MHARLLLQYVQIGLKCHIFCPLAQYFLHSADLCSSCLHLLMEFLPHPDGQEFLTQQTRHHNSYALT